MKERREDDLVILIDQTDKTILKPSEPTMERRATWRTTWLLSHILATLCLLLLVLLFITLHPMLKMREEKRHSSSSNLLSTMSESMDMETMSLSLSGQYIQTEVGADFEDYLVSLNMPRLLAAMMTQITEIVHIHQPIANEEEWSLTLSRGGEETRLRFELDRPFNTTIAADRSVISHVCQRPSADRLRCVMRQEERKLHLLSDMLFNEDGYVDHKTNLNNGVSSYKAFAKIHGALDHDNHDDKEKDRVHNDHDYIDQLPLDFWN